MPSSQNRNRSRRKKAEREGKRPKAKAQGKHLRNSCGSESGKGERKPSVGPSTGTWKEGMRNQAGEKGETEEARAETGTGKAAVRRNREEKERKNRRLSSWKRKRSGRKKVKRKWKIPEGKHLWNSCGSETGKDERKRTGSRVRRTGKEDTGNQVGKNGENQGSESGEGAPRKPL